MKENPEKSVGIPPKINRNSTQKSIGIHQKINRNSKKINRNSPKKSIGIYEFKISFLLKKTWISPFSVAIDFCFKFNRSIEKNRSARVWVVMIGHSFGLVSAVYNYNRRSAAITDFLRRIFWVAAFNFYDDKYGFETEATCSSAFECAKAVHWWLGAKFDPKKLQLCTDPTILGVTYDLDKMVLQIKGSRKEELLSEIDSIIQSGVLPPGQAGKLRGKLMFGASQLWGKIGRAFLRSLSERQYSKVPRSDVNKAIALSLRHWRSLIEGGPPRPIEFAGSRKADFVIFTDGSFPDAKSSLKDPWIGGVLFSRGSRPVQFGCRVDREMMDRWIPRKSQIAMVELFATVVALKTFQERLKGSWSLLFVDSESAQGALVKGYSAKEDLCELVGVFWDLALEIQVNLFI